MEKTKITLNKLLKFVQGKPTKAERARASIYQKKLDKENQKQRKNNK